MPADESMFDKRLVERRRRRKGDADEQYAAFIHELPNRESEAIPLATTLDGASRKSENKGSKQPGK